MRFQTFAKAVALAAAVLLAGNAWATNGYFTHGTGTKYKGLAGGGIALPQDSMIAATNPAGLAFVDSRTDVGAAFFSPRRSYQSTASQAMGNGGAFTIGPNDLDSGREWFVIPHFGHSWATDNGALALTFYGNGGMNTSWGGGTASYDPDGPGPAPVGTFPGTFGTGGEAGVDLAQLFANISYARRLNDKFSVGISFLAALQRFRAEGVTSFAPFTRTFAASGGMTFPASLSNNDNEISTGFGGKIGMHAALSENFSFAASYQSRISMSEFDTYADLFAENGGFDIPASASAGVAIKAGERTHLTLDAQHTWFSEADSVGNPISNIFACPTAGAGGTDIESCLGGARGAGFGWDDVTTVKLGVQWEGNNGWTWRAGYSHAGQPIPSSEVLFNILAPAVMEDHITFGFTKANGNNEWNAALMYAPKNEVTGANTFDPTQTITIEMKQIELEFSYSWK